MLSIRENVDLTSYNTFGIKASCLYFAEIHSANDFLDLLKTDVFKQQSKLVIGGGSNILLTGDFKGLIIRNAIKGIQIVSEDENVATVKASAGENWHGFVQFCINKGLGGIENLSLIPGCVGASPMQNIGAYGVEIKDVFQSLEAMDMQTGELRGFNKEECNFGYRESVFKHELKDKYLITSVSFLLSKKPRLNTSYGAINTELQAMGVSQPGIKDVSEAVIRIRRSKLPDPDVTGNAGSFFKNPEVSPEKQKQLLDKFPALVSYALENGNYKLAAGWLIEQCGLKGHSVGGAAVHLKQALVIINTGNARGADVLALSEHVISEVDRRFGVKLEREVNLIK